MSTLEYVNNPGDLENTFEMLERQSWLDFFKANPNPNLVYRAQYILFLVKRINDVYYIPKDNHCPTFGLSYSVIQDIPGLDITINLHNCLDWHVCDVNPIFNVETIKTLNNGKYKDKILYTRSGSMKIFSVDETGVRLVDMLEFLPHSLNCVSYQTFSSNLYYDRFHQIRALHGYESI